MFSPAKETSKILTATSHATPSATHALTPQVAPALVASPLTIYSSTHATIAAPLTRIRNPSSVTSAILSAKLARALN